MVLLRLARISLALWGYLLWWLLVRWRWRRPKHAPAEKLVHVLSQLGTTFIKLGQGLSLRSDLLPEEYIDALRGLQDRVAPFDGKQAVREVERAFKCDLHKIFADFDETPLAAASIAQVHVARLLDGREVVIKLRRPGVKEQVAQDMRILRRVVSTVLWFVPALEPYRPLAIIQELETNLFKELDFRQEARSLKRFAAAFADSKTIYVPGVVDDLYTESAIVQQRAGGLRVDDPAVRAQGPQLARALMDAYLYQLLVLGAFHADPHPGNLFVMADGRLCLHDFGLTGTLDPPMRRNLVALLQALMNRDSAWTLEVYLEMGMLSGEVNRRELALGLEQLVQDYADLPLRDWSVAEVFTRIARMGWANNIRLPHELLVLIRTMLAVETTARILDAHFNPFAHMLEQAKGDAQREMRRQSAAFARARFKHEAAVALNDLPGELGLWLRRVRREGMEMRICVSGLDHLEHHIDRSSNRVALALVILGLFIASSVLMQTQVGPRIADMPLTAIIGFTMAMYFTLRLVRGIVRSGRL